MLIGIVVNVVMVWGVYANLGWLLWPWLVVHFVVAAVFFVGPVVAIYLTEYENFILTASSQRWKVGGCKKHRFSICMFIRQ